jgi:hypothetical protein
MGVGSTTHTSSLHGVVSQAIARIVARSNSPTRCSRLLSPDWPGR